MQQALVPWNFFFLFVFSTYLEGFFFPFHSNIIIIQTKADRCPCYIICGWHDRTFDCTFSKRLSLMVAQN